MNQEEMIDDLAERIKRMQATAREISKKLNPNIPIKRGFHAKGNGLRAKFQVRSDIPENLQVGLFRPNAEYDGLVRFSNARSETLSDLDKDQRGLAIRIKTVEGASLTPEDRSEIQDFLMTNTPISFARSPVQFIEVGEILLRGIPMVLPRLWRKYGLKEAWRILSVFLQPLISFKPVQMNTFWSRTSYKFGNTAIRFQVRPAPGSKSLSSLQQFLAVFSFVIHRGAERNHYLRIKLGEALQQEDLRYEFCIQFFVDDKKTPIEDAYIEWKESDSVPIPLATLTIPKQAYSDALEQQMEHMAFNPWHTREHTPLGLINLARKKVYNASAENRGGTVIP